MNELRDSIAEALYRQFMWGRYHSKNDDWAAYKDKFPEGANRFITIAKAQLAKVQPMIEKAREDTWDKVMGAKKSGYEEGLLMGRKEVVELLGKALSIIYWMSGSSDFSPEGTAHEGWLTSQSDIEAIRQALKSGEP